MKAVRSQAAGAQRSFADDDLGLTLYGDAPNVQMSVREFEESVLERLRVLHTIDRVCATDLRPSGPGGFNTVAANKSRIMKEAVEARLWLDPPNAVNAGAFEDEKLRFCSRDSTSHFALRLAFCKTREARDWILKQEQRLLIFRYEHLSPAAQDAFVQKIGIRCKKFVESTDGPVTLKQLKETSPDARVFSDDGSKPTVDERFYEMPFHDTHPSLISGRRVVIKAGIAYVPISALKLILASRFKDRLSAALDVAFAGMNTALADPRVGGFIKVLQDHGMQLITPPKADGEEAAERLTPENFEALLTRSFPPCMRRLIERQRESKKHLKHAGRLQLRPFLKDCGFTFDESMQWWRQELCRDPEIDSTTYEKNYIYDVEHTYGKRGHNQGQHCFGCPKILGFPGEASGQVHGCPFKQLDASSLRQQLHKWKVSDSSSEEIIKLVNNGKHYQLSCIEYFKAIHPGHEGDGVGNSPKDFYLESCRVHNPKPAPGTTAPAAAGAAGA